MKENSRTSDDAGRIKAGGYNLHSFWIMGMLVWIGTTLSSMAATRIWTGGHASGANWNLRDNWDGSVVPTHGDTVVFPSGAARLLNTNNIPGLRLAEIKFLGLGGGYNLRGQSLTVSNGISVEADALNSLSVTSVTFRGTQVLRVAEGGQMTVNSDLVIPEANLLLDAAGDMSLRGVISGNGGVIKQGAGLVSYFGSDENTYRGETVVNEGTLALFRRETVSLVPLQVVNRIAVPGTLRIGNNSDSAVVRLNTDDQIADGALVIVNKGSEFRMFDREDAIGDLILSGGKVVMEGGKLGLNGNLTVKESAAGAIVEGEIVLRKDVQIDVEDGAAPIDFEFSARVTENGSRGLTKVGQGTMRLSGTNTYSGLTRIERGLVRVANDRAFGSVAKGTAVLEGASVQLDTVVNVLREPLTLAGSGVDGLSGALRVLGGAAIGTNVVLSAPATIHVLTGGNLEVDGVVSGTGPLTKIGPGTLEWGGKTPNEYSGDTVVTDGLMILSKTLGVSVPGDLIVGTTSTSAVVRHTRSANVGGSVTVYAGSEYDLSNNSDSIQNLTLMNGGLVNSGTGLLTVNSSIKLRGLVASLPANAVIEGRLRLGNGSGSTRITSHPQGQGAPDVRPLFIGAQVSGLDPIVKDGTGQLTLSSSNIFSGSLTVSEGTLTLANNHALGSPAGDTFVEGSAMMEMVNSIDVTDEKVILNSSITHQAGASLVRGAMVSIGSNSWSGTIVLAQSAWVGVYPNSHLNISGFVNGFGGLIKAGPGEILFTGSKKNTYLGATRVNEGRLRLLRTVSNGTIPGDLIIGDGVGVDEVECFSDEAKIHNEATVTLESSGRLRIHGDMPAEAIGSLAGSGRVILDGVDLETGFNGSSTEFSGQIVGNGAVYKHLGGTFLLSGDSTFSGGLVVKDGVLVVNGSVTNSSVYVEFEGVLKGTGVLGPVKVAGRLAPGNPAGSLWISGLEFIPGSYFEVNLNGESNVTGYGSVYCSGPVDFSNAILDLSLGYAPTQGSQFTLCYNTTGNPSLGNFVGLPEGAILVENKIPIALTYVARSSYGIYNDFAVRIGDPALRTAGVQIRAGNGNGFLDPDECNHLFVSLENTKGVPVNVLEARLQPMDPRILVIQAESDYGSIPAGASATNSPPFQVRISEAMQCGDSADFRLVLTTSAHGSFALPIQLDLGKAGPPISYESTSIPQLIPDGLWTAIPLEVTDDFKIAQARVNLHITHTAVGELQFRLRSPDNKHSVMLSDQRGGVGNNFGASCNQRTQFRDGAAVSIALGVAPFVGAYRPEESLGELRNVSSQGTWYLDVFDHTPGTLGAVQCWGLELTPFNCEPGGGGCETCVTGVSGVLNNSSLTMPKRLLREGPPSACDVDQLCYGDVEYGHPPYRFATHAFTNTGPTTCVTVAVTVPCDVKTNSLMASAYLGDFDPSNLCANWLGDSGREFFGGAGGFSFRVPAGERFTVVVNELNLSAPSSGCGEYRLDLYGLPCPEAKPVLHIAQDVGPDNVRLHWSTAYPGYILQGRGALGVGVVGGFTNVLTAPIVVEGDYSVTHPHNRKGNGFFRLEK